MRWPRRSPKGRPSRGRTCGCVGFPSSHRSRRSTPTPPGATTSTTWRSAYPRQRSTTWSGPTATHFGTPSRFGTPAAQLKQFIDTTGGLWQQGVLSGKPVTTFVSAINRHGGAEATILSLNNVFYHWGSILVPPGYTDSVVYGAGGNPYGTAHTTGMPAAPATEEALVAARYQGARLARIAAALTAESLVTAG